MNIAQLISLFAVLLVAVGIFAFVSVVSAKGNG